MLITDLDHLQSSDSASVHGGIGGIHPANTISLSFVGGALSLKQGESVLFETAIELPKKINISFEDASFVISSSSTQTHNGITQSSLSIITQKPSSPMPSYWPKIHLFGLVF